MLLSIFAASFGFLLAQVFYAIILVRIFVSVMKFSGARFDLRFLLYAVFCAGIFSQTISPLAAQSFSTGFSAWRELPVLDGGRVMPLETLARQVVHEICGTTHPFLAIDDTILDDLLAYAEMRERQEKNARDITSSSPSASQLSSPRAREIVARIRAIFPKGARKFSPTDLLLSWLSESEVWHYIPFLPAEDDAARNHFFPNSARQNNAGWTLTRVSPYQLTQAQEISQRLQQVERAGETDARSSLDTLATQLHQRYDLFSQLTFSFSENSENATQNISIKSLSLLRGAMVSSPTQRATYDLLAEAFPVLAVGEENSEVTQKLQSLDLLLRQLVSAYQQSDKDGNAAPLDFDALNQNWHQTLVIIDDLVRVGETWQKLLYARDTSDNETNLLAARAMQPQRRRAILLASIQFLAAAKRLRREVEAAWLALYDEGRAVRVFPITRGAELLSSRAEQWTAPWMSLTGITTGHELFIRRFIVPEFVDSVADAELSSVASPLAQVRQHWQSVIKSFDQTISQRELLLTQFSLSLRKAAQHYEPLRAASANADAKILRSTVYPSPQRMTLEVGYHVCAPVWWMILFSAISLVAITISWIYQRGEKFFFFAALGFLMLSILVMGIGGIARALISGWAPVTNMYETIVFMAWITAILGIGFSLAPALMPRISFAWRKTVFSLKSWRGILISAAQILLMGMIAWCAWELEIVVQHAREMSFFDAVKTFAGSLDFIDLTSVILTCGIILWFLPRLILVALFVPFSTNFLPEIKQQIFQQILQRKWFLAVPAAVTVIAGVIASLHPEFSSAIRPLSAVLRSNFWLTVHVIAIIASYATALVAWGLALVALVASLIPARKTLTVSKTPLYQTLAPYLTQMMRATVLLLALGIILGGRWADYSWGRFWGWDPKEVWALITMLYYAIILHSVFIWRHAQFFRKIFGKRFDSAFGITIGAAGGAIPVVMTWYGINYVFRAGMHAYAGGNATSATFFLYTFIGAHLLLLSVAMLSHFMKAGNAYQE